ncbi:hypothetical protein K1X22_09790 [Mycolicibacterium farcinogenes]|uniref:Transmembrane protein n=1 Tax=Mycolicibacterium conceptionense TaxID=451644 RepID=A0A0U1CWW6_9MYCO|nr:MULTISPECIES: hypothetical protein [Mycolicibacterium]ORV27398.1 hypothetical protein AWB98_10815 [Mycolicibacterium conceptionense]QZH61958.1 hypothetical protein K1X22_09790 [Mycolicibacterium farcinogenes]CQD03552.1 hypothetical protein BN970_00496 [Mycolicibacterium conceptionense]
MTAIGFLAATQNGALDLVRSTASAAPAILIIACVAMAFCVFICSIDYWSSKGTYRDMAQLMTQSSMFWARWSDDRIWSAPYGELAAEADRCEVVVAYIERQKKSLGKKHDDARAAFNEHIDRELVTYQGMLTAVRNAMIYLNSQGRGPQAPHGS